MGKVTITYNGAVISEAEETAPVTVQYHGSTIATLGAGESKTLSCGGKYMRSDLIIGSKTLSCGGKKMASNIGLVVKADSVEDDIITYTGTMTDQIVIMSNVAYRLLTLTSSGTLNLSNSRKADVWMCNGGNGGNGNSGAGGGGGYVYQERIQVGGTVACIIGAGGTGGNSDTDYYGLAGGATAIGAKKPAAQSRGANGASGGGASGLGDSAGNGAGTPTVPFSESGNFEQHSAGGGGGAYDDQEADQCTTGGIGGSNGGNGGSTGNNGTGGIKGGGLGNSSFWSGGNASFYGSGGGGGGSGYNSDGKRRVGYGGSGYQGIIYVRIPLDQSIYN